MDNPQEIIKIAQQRLKTAILLSTQNINEEALYFAGHSVELFLKAKLCKKWHIEDLYKSDDKQNNACSVPKIRDIKKTKLLHTHDIEILIILCGLYKEYLNYTQISNSNQKNFNLLIEWNNIRYKKNGSINSQQIKDIINFLNSKGGFIEWIANN